MVESSNTPVSPINVPAPSKARQAVTGFLKYTVDSPDLEKAKAFVTKRTATSGALHAAAVPPGAAYTLGPDEADELGMRIRVTVSEAGAPPGGPGVTVPVIVIEEEGEWKIDLPATMERMLGGAMGAVGEAMGAMGRAMSTALTGVTEAMNMNLSDTPAAAGTPAPTMASQMRAGAKKVASTVMNKARAAVSRATSAAMPANPVARPMKVAPAAKKSAKKKVAAQPVKAQAKPAKAKGKPVKAKAKSKAKAKVKPMKKVPARKKSGKRK